MNKAKASSRTPALPPFPEEQLRQALGGTPLPGSVQEFGQALRQPKQSALRCRRGVESQDLPMPTGPVPWYRLGRLPTESAARPSRFLAFAGADYYVQDAGSFLALAVAGADDSDLAGLTICDLCAAPGGKATALVEAMDAAAMTGSGFVLANEVIASRIGALKLNLARTGSDRYAISSLDPGTLADRLPGRFDVVVVDAPCSGQALLSRQKQKASSLSISQIRHSASRQCRILDAALRLVRRGGRIVYSTCTFAEAENESQVERLASAGLAEPQPVDRLATYQTTTGCYRLWPHLHPCAGSFAANLVVHSDPNSAKLRLPRRGTVKLPVDLASWYESPDQSTRFSLGDSVIHAWPDDAPDWVEAVALAGPELAYRSGRTWRPSHAAALRRVPRAPARLTSDIDDHAAKSYLRGETIECPQQGWSVVHHRGRPLGWIKGNGRIGKNHLPASARMLGDLQA